MIARFFNHSKPIAYIALCAIFMLAFVIENFFSVTVEVTAGVIFSKLGVLLVFLAIGFLFNTIVKKNNIHQQHSFAVSSVVFMVVAFPEVLRASELIISYLFLILALRRIYDLKTNTLIKQKLLDASLFLSASTWLEPFHLLFLVVIYFGVVMYASQDFRHFIIPIVGLFVGFVLLTCYALVFENRGLHVSEYIPQGFSLDVFKESFKYRVLSFYLFVLLVWVIIKLPSLYRRAKLHESESLSLTLFSLVISLVIMATNTNTIALDAIYIIFPLSILIGNYLQLKTTRTWVRESIYGLFLAGILFSALY